LAKKMSNRFQLRVGESCGRKVPWAGLRADMAPEAGLGEGGGGREDGREEKRKTHDRSFVKQSIVPHGILQLRTCPKNQVEGGLLRWRSRWVSHPFAKNANGWGTERLCRVGSGQIPFFGQLPRGNP